MYARIVTPEEMRTESAPRGSRPVQPRPPAQVSPPRQRSAPAVPAPKSTPSRRETRPRAEQQEARRSQAPAPSRDVPSQTDTASPRVKESPDGVLSTKGGIPGQGAGKPDGPGTSRKVPSPGSGPGSTRDKIFDRDVIAKLPQRGEPGGSRPDSGGITFNTKDFRYHGYLQRLRERIEHIWRYPEDAARNGIYGDLYIRFTITKNGKLGSVELVRTSGHRSLDDAAIRALRDAEPYWPLPDEWGSDTFTITGHFVYSMYGTRIR